MKLSPHFSDTELRVAGGSVDAIAAATFLCNEVLEPIREHFGRPLIVLSGHRDVKCNAGTGGVKDSQHLYENGSAAVDFVIVGSSCRTVYDWIRLESKLPVDQLILEKDKTTGEVIVIHISINYKKTPRRQALVGQTHGTGSYTREEFNV